MINVKYKIECYEVGPLPTNCYFFINDDTKEAVIIDPGPEAEELITSIERKKIYISAILLTHGHSDHVNGAEGLRKEIIKSGYYFKNINKSDSLENVEVSKGDKDSSFQNDKMNEEDESLLLPIYASELEKETLSNPSINVSPMIVGILKKYRADIFLHDGEELSFCGTKIKVLSTPGHTMGGCSYYIPDAGAVFSGDSLFFDSIGRTDFPGGSTSALVHSVKEKLFTLPDDTKVYTGHGPETSIGFEKKNNPYLQ